MSGRPRRSRIASRRRIALVGVAAILFQAILFGWHHHSVALGRSGAAASLSNASNPLAPATAEDVCEICIALHHQSAAPLAFIVPPRPSVIAIATDRPETDPVGCAFAQGFCARAPPRA